MEEKKPEVGMGATLIYWSDREPATIIQVSHNHKKIVLQKDKAIRTDNNGMSDSQTYDFEADPNGAIFTASLRKDGRYRITGSKQLVIVGSRRKYYDYHF